MLSALFSSRRRSLITVLAWCAIIIALFLIAPGVKDVQSAGDNGAAPDAASIITKEKLTEKFEGSDALPAIITVSGDEDKATKVTEIVQELRNTSERFGAPISPMCRGFSPDCIPANPETSVSKDERTRLIVVPISGEPSDDAFRSDVDTLREALPEGTHVTGPAGIITDTVKVFAQGDRILMVGTVLLVLVILLAVYRAPVLAILPLIAVTVALLLTQAIAAMFAQAGWITITAQSTAIMTVLLFGIGTDYALVLTSRWREYLRDDHPPTAAMVEASKHTTSVILSSAGTIIVAMLALLTTATPTLRGFGPYFALGVGSMALVAFTFLPAIMVLAGRAALWPTKPEQGQSSKLWTRIADFTLAHPKRIVAVCLVVLAFCSLGLLGYRETFNFTSGFRVPTDSADGQTTLAQAFGPGEIAPTTLLLEGKDIADAAAKVSEELDGVARVAFNPRNDVASSGEAARVTVVLNEDPYSLEALENLNGIVEDAQRIVGDSVTVSASGVTAENTDIRTAIDADVLLLIPLIFGIIGLILAILLRSWLAPIYLVATLAISFLATLGLTTFIAVTVQGDDGIGAQISAYILVFLTALGVDYTIFIMERLRQELPGNTMTGALRTALVTTGGVVSSAGLILAATFAVLMTQPIRELYQFGLAMALGILIDTFLVRPLLVPAIVTLLGDKALAPQQPGKKSSVESRLGESNP